MADGLLHDLPRDLPTFLERFGTDEDCRAYLVQARWPAGFGCTACGHDQAYSHKKRLIEECRACGKQHSILAGTIFEQTKTGLARWFLAIYLVTASKGGISAMELQRQMGFGSYGTAWAWLHKIRRAMVVPDRKPLSERVEADETLVGGARPGKPGRGASARPWSRVRSRAGAASCAAAGSAACACRRWPMLRPAAWLAFSNSQAPPKSPPTAGRAIAGSSRGLRPPADPARPVLARRAPPAGHPPGLRLPSAAAGTHHGAVSAKHLQAYLDEYVFRFNRRTPRASPTASPPDRAGRPHPTDHLPRHHPRQRLNVTDS